MKIRNTDTTPGSEKVVILWRREQGDLIVPNYSVQRKTRCSLSSRYRAAAYLQECYNHSVGGNLSYLIPLSSSAARIVFFRESHEQQYQIVVATVTAADKLWAFFSARRV